MTFLSDGVWWGLLAGAALLFALYIRLRRQDARSPVTTSIQLGCLALIALAFVFTDWRGGLGACVGVAISAPILPRVIGLLLRLVPVFPPEPAASPALGRPSLGPLADLWTMIDKGASRAKVWQLIQQGKLVAFKDPKTDRVTLIRRNDLDALRQARSKGEKEDGS